MPFYGKRKRSSSRFRSSRRRSARRVSYKVKRYVKRAIDKSVEDKMVTWSLQTHFGSVSTTGADKFILEPTQGTAMSQRVGKRIRVKSIQIKGVLAVGASQVATDDHSNTVRILLASWNANMGNPISSYSIAIDSVVDKRNNMNLLRHKYIDRIIPLTVASTESGSTGDGYVPRPVLFNYFKRFKNFYITYGSDVNQTSPDKCLTFSMVSDSTAVPNPGFTSGFVKVIFEDA